ncbi:VWA domain-containing protein [Paracoccus jeotgali]|nr:VWA domain-containing protein [Paracoccus jeotgali]
MTRIRPILATALIVCAGAGAVHAAEDVAIVYDASGSMWGQIDGRSKVEIAREVMADLVNGWEDGTNLGLVAYGHRRQGDCTDIETLIAPGPLDKAGFIERVNAIRPVGKTPLSAAVRHAAELLSWRDNPATVVLISDGLETCNADPCALAAELAQQGVGFTAHVVGFDLGEDVSLACIAENTGGVFVPASNAQELQDALAQVKTVIESRSEPAPPPPVEVPAVTLTGPATVTTGATFDVSWSGTINPRDYITILPMGAKEGQSGTYIRVDDDNKGTLTAPAETGIYELRYVLNEGAKTLASVAIEVVAPAAGVSGPATVTTGAIFDVSWSGTINPRDYITILPMGAKEGQSGTYIRVAADSKGTLTAPAETGMYELRYVLNEGGKTLATAAIEVVAPEVGVSGPATVTTGANFAVTWSGTINPRDYITILPMGAKEGQSGPYIRVADDTEGSLTAPAETGMYELRYVLNEGAKTLATAAIEVVAPEVGVSGPATVTTGANFDVTWSGTINPRDYITILPMGAKEGQSGTYIRVADDTDGTLTAPAETGMYELRYVLNEGAKTLASVPIEVVGVSIDLTAPPAVRAGSKLTIGWTQSVNPRDYITIVPAGEAEGKHGGYVRVETVTSREVTAPDAPGLYEIRYVLNEGAKTLGRKPLEVRPADAPMDDGAGLTVPASAAPGETVTITWTGGGTGTDERIALARKEQPDFTWLTAMTATDAKTLNLQMPQEPGLYEIRFLDLGGPSVLGRAVVEVR